MTTERALLLCSCLLLNALTIASGCSKRLGDNNELVTFQCMINGAPDVAWRLNNMDLPENDEKYQRTLRHLTVTDIDGSDEGNYTCMSGQQTYPAGCLLVYGKAHFDSNYRNIKVSADGTITFNLTLSFTQSGPSMKKQTVSKYTLKKNGNSLVTCNPVCHTNLHQWWTVESVENGHIFVLHQAKSTDRGIYRAQFEVVHPHDSTIHIMDKSLFVTSLICDPYPGIINGTVSTLESTTSINGAQANYSCDDGCKLQGSRSLRCLILIMGFKACTQWVNETGQKDTPSCFCPITAILSHTVHSKLFTSVVAFTEASKPTPTFTASSESSQSSSTHQDLSSKSTRSVFIQLSKDDIPEGQSALPIIVAVCVLVFIIVAVIVIGIIAVAMVFKRKHRGKNWVPQPEVETCRGRIEDDPNADL